MKMPCSAGFGSGLLLAARRQQCARYAFRAVIGATVDYKGRPSSLGSTVFKANKTQGACAFVPGATAGLHGAQGRSMARAFHCYLTTGKSLHKL